MKPSPWPLLTAFTIWFAHFMVCWAASELVWPHQRMANVVAWVATVVALLALGMQAWRLRGFVPVLQRRRAQGATALATVAVVFSALPAFVLIQSA